MMRQGVRSITRYLPCLALLLGISLGTGLDGPSVLAQGCGGPEVPCEIENGVYHASLPDDWAGGPAIIHLHGYRGRADKTVGNKGFAGRINARGYALIAPQGLPWHQDKPKEFEWSVRDGYDKYPRDDIAFVAAVIADAVTRFGVDRDRVLLTGFSRGGSMVWDIACHAPGTAAAYAPTAGGFWRPHPADCAGPVKLLHTHGFKDGTVPLEGRPLSFGGHDFVQGDIFEGLQIWRRALGCGQKARAHEIGERFWRKRWNDCAPGATLEIALHPGGHGLAPGWSSMVIDWFEARLAAD